VALIYARNLGIYKGGAADKVKVGLRRDNADGEIAAAARALRNFAHNSNNSIKRTRSLAGARISHRSHTYIMQKTESCFHETGREKFACALFDVNARAHLSPLEPARERRSAFNKEYQQESLAERERNLQVQIIRKFMERI
jgi:hypothetical protein